jgi:hypothetical protein
MTDRESYQEQIEREAEQARVEERFRDFDEYAAWTSEELEAFKQIQAEAEDGRREASVAGSPDRSVSHPPAGSGHERTPCPAPYCIWCRMEARARSTEPVPDS